MVVAGWGEARGAEGPWTYPSRPCFRPHPRNLAPVCTHPGLSFNELRNPSDLLPFTHEATVQTFLADAGGWMGVRARAWVAGWVGGSCALCLPLTPFHRPCAPLPLPPPLLLLLQRRQTHCCTL